MWRINYDDLYQPTMGLEQTGITYHGSPGSPSLCHNCSPSFYNDYNGWDALDRAKFLSGNTFSIDGHGIKLHNGYVIAKKIRIDHDTTNIIEGSWNIKNRNWVRCSHFTFDLGVNYPTTPYPAYIIYHKMCEDDEELISNDDNRINNDGSEAKVEKHQVKCCSSKEVASVFTQRMDSLIDPDYICPYRAVDSQQCPGPKTIEEAVDYCDSLGGRLCSSKELYHGCAGPEMHDPVNLSKFYLKKTNQLSCDSDLIWSGYTIDYGPTVETGCRDIQLDPRRYSQLMKNCDDSMALLLGASTSIGSLVKIVKAIQDFGVGRMPGHCCLDDATTSDFLGYNVRLYDFLFCMYTQCCCLALISNPIRYLILTL